jgi:ribulose-phosphate 3-epimerase
MKAYASLWSADLLAIGEAVTLVEQDVDGFHVDVFDGHNVRDLLFGPDFVGALRRHTDALLDIHLNVEEPDYWAQRFIEAGADMITVQLRACDDPRATLRDIAQSGARPAVALEIDDDPVSIEGILDIVDRVVVMGTAIGIKGAALHEDAPRRVRQVRDVRHRCGRCPEVIVDGGIRRDAVTTLAAAGADGVVPGSLVFADPDPRGAVRWIKQVTADSPNGAS